MHATRPSVGGIESEVAFVAMERNKNGRPSKRRIEAGRATEMLVKLAMSQVLHLPVSHRNLGIMLANGGLLYQDAAQGGAHPELCTPECRHPRDLILYREAGYRLLDDLATADSAAAYTFFRHSVDPSSRSSWATHFSCETAVDFHTIGAAFLPFLVSKSIYAGSGGFDAQGGFVLAPRLLGFGCDYSADTEGHLAQGRPLICIRERPVIDGLRRQEFICHENVLSHLAGYLDLGLTWLVMILVNHGRLPAIAVRNPVEALRAFNADPSGTQVKADVEGVPGKRTAALSALDIQRYYLEWASASLGESWMPDWGREILTRFDETLSLIALGPEAVSDRLDWAIKLNLFRACGFNPGTQVRPQILELDVRFGQCGGQGLFSQLDQAGCLEGHHIPGVDPPAIEAALTTPPTGTRAAERGEWIARLGAEPDDRHRYWATWERIEDRDRVAPRVLRFPHPLGGNPVDWTPVQQPTSRPTVAPSPPSLPSDVWLQRYAVGDYEAVVAHFRSQGETVASPLRRYAAWSLARTGHVADAIQLLDGLHDNSAQGLDDRLLVLRFAQLRPSGEEIDSLVTGARALIRQGRAGDNLVVNVAAILNRRGGFAQEAERLLRSAPPHRDQRIRMRQWVELAESGRQLGTPYNTCLDLLTKAAATQRAQGWLPDLADFTLPTLARLKADQGAWEGALTALSEARTIQRACHSPLNEARNLLLGWRILRDQPREEYDRFASLVREFPWLGDDETINRIDQHFLPWLEGGADPESGSDFFWWV